MVQEDGMSLVGSIEALGSVYFAEFEFDGEGERECQVYRISEGGLEQARAVDEIREAVVDVAASGFMRDIFGPQDPFYNEVVDHAFGCDTEDKEELFLFLENGEIHGFSKIRTFRLPTECGDLKVMHIGALVLDVNIQGNGLGSRFIEHLSSANADGAGYDIAVYHTANRAMRAVVERLGSHSPKLAEVLAPMVRSKNVRHTISDGDIILVEPGRYGQGGLYGESLGEYLIPGLNENSGDAQICAYFLDPDN
jgi:GNAT superfamily N-acetyltransferase